MSAQPPGDRGPTKTLDIADMTAGVDPLIRVSGVGGEIRTGFLGIPVAGGFDVDGDSLLDYALSYMTGSLNNIVAGEAYLVFGNGTVSDDLAAESGPRVLRMVGNGFFEATGSEIWMGDVTGDGLGDLIVCRQNFNPGARVAAGAISIVVGSPALASMAAALQVLDLDNPPATVDVFTLVGTPGARLGIWARVADVDGDGFSDLIAGADQESVAGENHSGAVYVIRGGSHFATTGSLDLASFGFTSLAGSVARIVPPAGAGEFHFGATVQSGDLDGNGRAEVLIGAGLNRIGASLGPNGFPTSHGVGGPAGGRAWIVWDDLFPAGNWPAGYTIDLGTVPDSVTTVFAGDGTVSLGEEILGGLDYNGDGKAEFFLGDLAGDGTEDQSRPFSGLGFIYYTAENLKGQHFNADEPPPGVQFTKILGPEIGAIGSDTVTHGDYDGDGIDDLMIGSPTAAPLGRVNAGVMHVLYGRPGQWPNLIDTASGMLPPQESVRITEILGALGRGGPGDDGDVLAYSATSADLDGDGKDDIIVNEMRGNGVGGALDIGNLIVLDGDFVSPPANPANN